MLEVLDAFPFPDVERKLFFSEMMARIVLALVQLSGSGDKWCHSGKITEKGAETSALEHGNVEHGETHMSGNGICEARGEKVILQTHLVEKYTWTLQLSNFYS